MRAMWDSSGVRFIREMVTVYFDRRVSRSAAELAYFLVLSFFPVLICINAFVGLMLDWIKDEMKQEPEALVNRFALVIQDDLPSALNRFRVDAASNPAN